MRRVYPRPQKPRSLLRGHGSTGEAGYFGNGNCLGTTTLEWPFNPVVSSSHGGVHITISWILLDPPKRAKQYIEHGLGQAILALEHRKSRLDSLDDEDKKLSEQAIKAEESWINAQKLSFLIDVNVGAWSGKSTRDMAEEAGLLDFYNYVYTPFSQCAHSTWYHVGRYNSSPSKSPLTRQLWIPRITDSTSDVWELHLVAKYIDKTFNTFDEKALGLTPNSNLHDWIYDEIRSR